MNVSDGSIRNYTIEEMSIESRRVDKLSEYMFMFGDQYNLDRVARLPSEEIKIGKVKVTADKRASDGDDFDYP